MGIFDKFKKKVGDYVEGKKTVKENKSKLRLAQDQFERAKAKYENSLMDDREKLYIGTHEIDPDVNDNRTLPNSRRKANNVINIIYEIIESQIDTTIPSPSVKSRRQGHEILETKIENSIKNDMLEADIYRINDENERTTPVQGFSIMTVEWNPDFEHHLYRGDIKIDNIHPKQLIPQPGVYNIQKMEYFFLVGSESREWAEKRYGIDLQNEGEQYPEYNTIDGNTDNPDDEDNVTVITKWYKNKDNKISKLTWINDKICEDMDNYFARRIDGKVEEEETLVEDVTKYNGEVIPAGTKIKYFCPTRFPIIIRKNVPVPYYFGGQSDVDVIRDQADCVKKVTSTMEEKILRGGVIVTAKNDHKFDLKNKLYQIVRGEQDELSAMNVLNLQANIQQDLEFFRQQYKAARDTIGITDSFQGKPDTTAKSGVAKQLAIFQSTGRMDSKKFNKQNAYKELFEIMFEFKLAFYDEVRPYMKVGQNGETEYGEFNKYDFVEKDASGEWYYNTDFLFNADAGDGIPKDKMWLMNQTIQFATAGFMTKPQFWAAMERLGYPSASDYKQQAIAEQQQQEQIAQQQMQMQQQALQQQQQMQMEEKQMERQEKLQEMELSKNEKLLEYEMKKNEHEMKRDIEIMKIAQNQQKITQQKPKGGE